MERFTRDHIFVLQLMMEGFTLRNMTRLAVNTNDLAMLIAIAEVIEWFKQGGVDVT